MGFHRRGPRGHRHHSANRGKGGFNSERGRSSQSYLATNCHSMFCRRDETWQFELQLCLPVPMRKEVTHPIRQLTRTHVRRRLQASKTKPPTLVVIFHHATTYRGRVVYDQNECGSPAVFHFFHGAGRKRQRCLE